MKDREYTKEQLIKELEESLQTNEFLSLLLESMPVAVYTCEAGGDFGATYISNNITLLTGYKPEDFTSHSEFWFYNVHPDDKEMVNVNLLTLLQTGHISYEYRWRVADGSYKWFYDISKLMKAQSGGSNCIIGTFIDITERKKTEEALKTNEEKYRLLFSTKQDAIIIVNAETRRIVDANDAALRLYGYSKEEILKLTGPDLSAEPEESDAAISKVAMSTDNQIHYHTRNHRKKDGTVFPVELSSGIFMLKERKFISAAIRDITHRKQALEEQQKSAFYLDNVNDTLIVINANREIIKVNKEISNLWDYSSDEVLGKSVFILFPQEEMPIHLAEMEKAIFTKDPRNFETFALTKSGQKVPLSIRGSAIFDNDGKLEGFIGIFRDITERKRMEEKLHAMSITDELTGLYNRRGFFSLVNQQLKIANRMKKGLLLLYADVDSLKLINDEFGHKAGDLILVKAANLLKEVFRESDIIARIGGDEFVVVSIGVDDRDVEKIEARFEQCLEDYNAKRDHVFRLSMSKGMSYYQQECHYSVDKLLVEADKLMYDQKKKKKKS